MKKQILLSILVLGLTAVSAQADDPQPQPPEVIITSFMQVIPNTRLAELCGRVISFTGESIGVKVLVDHQSSYAHTYNTLAAKDGRFCLTLMTHLGRAEATAWSLTAESAPVPALLSRE